MTGPEHYREAERLLADAFASKDTTFEGYNPEADRMIAAAHVHALLAVGAPPQSPYVTGETRTAGLDSETKAMALSASPEAWSRLGHSLRVRRQELGLSRRALSEKADVSEKSIQVAEEGRVPSARWPHSIGRIARALGWEPEAAIAIVLTEYAEEAL